MTEDQEYRIYQRVYTKVIWDEPREDVFQMMEVNGITDKAAQKLYDQAVEERVASIRADALRRCGWGLVIFLPSASLLYTLIVGVRAVTYQLLVLCGVGATIGGWRVLNGIYDFAFARIKRGSLACE